MNTLTQEQVRELAKNYDAECSPHSDNHPYLEWVAYEFSLEELTSFANAAFALGVAQEREACAVLSDDFTPDPYSGYPECDIAKAIRARK